MRIKSLSAVQSYLFKNICELLEVIYITIFFFLLHTFIIILKGVRIIYELQRQWIVISSTDL